MTIMKSNRLP